MKDLWRELYTTADAFRKAAFWRWMDDTMLFGVEDPQSGEINYCLVLGNAGEVFAFQVYLGKEGLLSYIQMREGLNSRGSLSYLKLLEVGFEDRDKLLPEDLAQIKKLGLSFRGRQEWPMFRSYRPGYYPWLLEEAEGKLLFSCLEQAMEICPMFEDGYSPPGVFYYPLAVRYYAGGEWATRWQELPDIGEDVTEPPAFNELELYKAARLRQGDAVWVTDIRMFPQPMQDNKGQRPYFPLCFLLMDKNSGTIISVELVEPSGDEAAFPRFILKTMEKAQIRPQAINAASPEAMHLLINAAKSLGFELRQRQSAKLEDAYSGLMDSI